jgi:hypothetical protein
MARKQIGPALYELMRGRRPESRTAEPRSPETTDWGWLSPGRTLRVPVGYLLLAAAVVCTAVAASFTIGYGRGEARTRAEIEQQWLATTQPTLPPPESRPEPAPRTPPAPAAVETPEGPAPAEGPGWGPIQSDPRQPGKNYFVLIHTQRDNAVRLAQFSRDHGVEAYVVRAKNLSLYKVVALPGYERGERSADFVRALERQIEEVFRRWKLQINPRDDLAHYPEKYEG